MKRFILVICLVVCALPASAQSPLSGQTAAAIIQQVRELPNITYLNVGGWDGKLDIYAQRTGPTATVIYIHGGGWVRGKKDTAVFQIVPYLQMGYSVVNIEYRLG